MKDLFGSDDEDEDNPKDIIDKTKDLTAKLNNLELKLIKLKKNKKRKNLK